MHKKTRLIKQKVIGVDKFGFPVTNYQKAQEVYQSLNVKQRLKIMKSSKSSHIKTIANRHRRILDYIIKKDYKVK